MKSGILPLFALGIGAWFLSKPKATQTESKSKGIVIGSKERGYVITNCNLVIYDKQKALDYAFNLGIKEAQKTKPSVVVVRFNLFGDCLNTDEKSKLLINDDKTKALFIFDMLKFLFSGVASMKFIDDVTALDNINKVKESISKITGIDTSDFKVELVKKQ